MKIIVTLVPENDERVLVTHKHGSTVTGKHSLNYDGDSQVVLENVSFDDEIVISELVKELTPTLFSNETVSETGNETGNETADTQDVDTQPVLGDTTPS